MTSRGTLDGFKEIQQHYNQWELIKKKYMLNTRQNPKGKKELNMLNTTLKHRRFEKINFSLTRQELTVKTSTGCNGKEGNEVKNTQCNIGM